MKKNVVSTADKLAYIRTHTLPNGRTPQSCMPWLSTDELYEMLMRNGRDAYNGDEESHNPDTRKFSR